MAKKRVSKNHPKTNRVENAALTQTTRTRKLQQVKSSDEFVVKLRSAMKPMKGQLRCLNEPVNIVSNGKGAIKLTGLPAGTDVVSAWVSNDPNCNYANDTHMSIHTDCVQLWDDGKTCRIRYWTENMSSAIRGCVMIIYGKS